MQFILPRIRDFSFIDVNRLPDNINETIDFFKIAVRENSQVFSRNLLVFPNFVVIADDDSIVVRKCHIKITSDTIST